MLKRVVEYRLLWMLSWWFSMKLLRWSKTVRWRCSEKLSDSRLLTGGAVSDNRLLTDGAVRDNQGGRPSHVKEERRD